MASTTDVPFTVEHVEALVRRLYRLDAELGGDELCSVVASQARVAADLCRETPHKPGVEHRLITAAAGLTQLAGWLAIDSNQHAQASQYLTSTIYAAREIEDLGLAGHAVGYMSLHAFYRDHPREALALAETAGDLAQSPPAGPRTRATLHNRAARAHARLGNTFACRHQLDLAAATSIAEQDRDNEPQWIAYVDEVELAAQRGACFLDLNDPERAIDALTEAIRLLLAAAPGRSRDLAHYRIRLAKAYLLRGDYEQVAAVARQARTDATQVGSARINQRFAELVEQLDYYDSPEIRDLRAELIAR